MARDEERHARSQEGPIVDGLPDAPGILTALRLTPGLGLHLRGLADELLVNRFVEGFRASTPPTTEAYRARAGEIAEHGYRATAVTSVPR